MGAYSDVYNSSDGSTSLLANYTQFLKCAKDYMYSQNSFKGLAKMFDTIILGIHGSNLLSQDFSFGFSEQCGLIATKSDLQHYITT